MVFMACQYTLSEPARACRLSVRAAEYDSLRMADSYLQAEIDGFHYEEVAQSFAGTIATGQESSIL